MKTENFADLPVLVTGAPLRSPRAAGLQLVDFPISRATHYPALRIVPQTANSRRSDGVLDLMGESRQNALWEALAFIALSLSGVAAIFVALF
jgi:hypothetical protein